MPDFSRRSLEEEIMDDLACSGEVVHQTLRELENINALLGGNYVTLDGIRKLVEEKVSPHFRIDDLGCGSGDMLRLIRKWSLKKGLDLKLTGLDANPFIVDFARKHTPPECKISYEAVDIFSEAFRSRTFDVVTGTLFFHHFSDDQLVSFFRQLKAQTRIGFVINDIHRHWFAYYAIRWLTTIFSRSFMVKYDAPLSVLRAFRKKELVRILRAAGITRYSIRWMWAFRWQVIVRIQE
jgi:2-polyprenyl-3-methyl-5-hydroxy-6-metoxy-1,4-benzoquinol methylase